MFAYICFFLDNRYFFCMIKGEHKLYMEDPIITDNNLTSKIAGSDEGPRVNSAIKAPKIRLIDETGENRGVVSLKEALALADEAGLDLIEISPMATPPVCKILDFGKYRYELQKRKSEAKKKQKIVETKELKLRPAIDTHDYEVKLKQAKKFLSEGNKVKFTMRYRGREMSANNLGQEILDKIVSDLELVAKVDSAPKMEGRQMSMMMSPI